MRLLFSQPRTRGGLPVYLIEKRREDNTLAASAEYTFTAASHWKQAASDLGITKSKLQEYLDNYKRGANDTVSLATTANTSYRLRGERSATVVEYPAFPAALASVAPGEVIEWDGIEATCNLDVDFHGTQAPSEADITRLLDTLSPVPSHTWLSRNGGFHAIYQVQGNFTADALASLAAVAVVEAFPECTVELLHRTRAPSGAVTERIPTVATPREVSEDDGSAYTEWLADNGYTPGQRLPHTLCPINPSARSSGNIDPVVVFNDHIFCYSCRAAGLSGVWSAKRPGSSLLKLCVANLTHFEHAKYVVEQSVPAQLARGVYRAALVAKHGSDPRVPKCFTSGDNLVRYQGHWGDVDGMPVVFKDGKPSRLAALPCSQYVDATGELAVDLNKVEWLTHCGDLSRYGYPAIVPVFGVAISLFLDPPPGQVRTILPAGAIKGREHRDKQPRYLPPANRVTDPWGAIEAIFPGINREAVRLLIAAKGCIECPAGLPPMLFFTGPTGSSKTATIQIASAICGDKVTVIPYASNTERQRAGILAAKKTGSYASFDEFIKGAKKEGADATAAMEMLLNFTPDSESHMLYVGPVALGNLPVCVWCDTSIPPEVQAHAQLGRRLVHGYFPATMDWQGPLRDSGIHAPSELRSRGSPEIRAACDSVLSEVIDTYFASGVTPIFQDIARAMGFKLLGESSFANEKKAAITRLFNLVCAAPPLSGEDARRWPANGYKLIDLARDGSELTEVWRELTEYRDRGSSQAVSETDLRAVLGLRTAARLDSRINGQKVVVRFRSTDGSIINAALRLEPEQPGIDGHRNAISSEPAPSGEQSILAPPIDTATICGIPDWPDLSCLGSNGT